MKCPKCEESARRLEIIMTKEHSELVKELFDCEYDVVIENNIDTDCPLCGGTGEIVSA